MATMKWCALNPNGKTSYERRTIRKFNSLDEAKMWQLDGRRIKHGYILRYLEVSDEGRIIYTDELKKLLKSFDKKA